MARKRKPTSAQTKSKISRALKGKKRKIGVAAAGVAAVGGLGYIGLRTYQKTSGKGMKSVGNNQPMRGIASTTRSPGMLVPSQARANEGTTIPTSKMQSAEIAVVTQPNALQRAGEMVAKVPGAKNAYMVGQQARAGYEQGPSQKTQSRLNSLAGWMGRKAARDINTVRTWTSRGKV